jgi:hypothetical protein
VKQAGKHNHPEKVEEEVNLIEKEEEDLLNRKPRLNLRLSLKKTLTAHTSSDI